MSSNQTSHTFVEFQLNARGLSTEARSHVVKSAARVKKALRSQNVPPKFTSPLPWRYLPRDAACTTGPDKIPGRDVTKLDRQATASTGKTFKDSTDPSSNSEQSWSSPSSTASSHPSDNVANSGSTEHKKSSMKLSIVEQRLISNEGTENSDSAANLGRWGPGTHPDRSMTDVSFMNGQPSFASLDQTLLKYFVEHADSMLHFDRYPDLLNDHEPVKALFLPFAMAGDWCFETMVLLFSAYHYRRFGLGSGFRTIDEEYITSKRNKILEKTRNRMSAVAHGDSTDDDVVALLFLAISEYELGDRQVGLLHMAGWKTYLETRRIRQIPNVGQDAKVIVWWVSAMILGSEPAPESVLDPVVARQIAANPARLFRYLDRCREEGDRLSSSTPDNPPRMHSRSRRGSQAP